MSAKNDDAKQGPTAITPNDFQTAAGPSWLGLPSRGDENLLAQQYAVGAVVAQAIDADLLAAVDGPLPSERRIINRFATWRAQAEQGRLRDASMDAETLYAVQFDGVNARAEERAALDADRKAANAQLSDAVAEKTVCDALLAGEPRLEDGARFPGRQPEATPHLPVRGEDAPKSARAARARLRRRSAVVAHIFAEWGLLAAAAIVEGIMLVAPIEQATYQDNVAEAVLLALGAIVSATLLPHLIGQELAALRHGAHLSRRRGWVLVLLAVWPLTAIAIGYLREQHVQTISDITKAQAGPGVPTLPFNAPFQLVLWPTLLLLVGVAVLVIKTTTWNPVKAEILLVNTALAMASWKLGRLAVAEAGLTAREQQHEAFVATHRQVMADNQARWAHYEKVVLPAMEAEARAVHNAALADAMANPDATGLIAGAQPGEQSGGAPVAPLSPVDPRGNDDIRRSA
jgi:hypothetical protein